MNRQLRLGIILFLLTLGLTFTAGQVTQAAQRIACGGCILTPKGIVVTKTSDDPNLVAVLQEHSREISNYVERGNPWMGGGGMRWW